MTPSRAMTAEQAGPILRALADLCDFAGQRTPIRVTIEIGSASGGASWREAENQARQHESSDPTNTQTDDLKSFSVAQEFGIAVSTTRPGAKPSRASDPRPRASKRRGA